MIVTFMIPISLKDEREIKNIPKHFCLPLELLENAGIPSEFVSVTLAVIGNVELQYFVVTSGLQLNLFPSG